MFPTPSDWSRIPGDPSDPTVPTSFSSFYLVDKDPAEPSQSLLTNEIVYQFRIQTVSTDEPELISSEFSDIAQAIPSAEAERRPRLPVVLVPGWFPQGAWETFRTYVVNTLKWRFGGELVVREASPLLDPEVGFVAHEPDPAGNVFVLNFRDDQIENGLDVWALELRATLSSINNFRLANGLLKTKFVVVAHSSGGVAARSYIQGDIFRDRDDIFQLITYGTPHQGTKLSFVAALFALFGEELDAGSLGLQQLDPDSNFMETLNGIDFPPGVFFTSIIGKWHCPPFHLLNRGGDGIFTDENQNMGKLPVRLASHKAHTTRVCHGNERADVVNIIRAIGHGSPIPLFDGVDDVRVSVASPVDLIVTDPLGRTISKTSNAIPVAVYEEDEDDTGHRHDIVTIPLAFPGGYAVEIVAEPDALPTDTFTLEVTVNGVTTVLAQDQQVQDIPADPFVTMVADIDIEPDTASNRIELDEDDEVSVAILSTQEFAAPLEVNQASLTFGSTGDEMSFESCDDDDEDLNRDGLLDLICDFDTRAAGFQLGDIAGILKGETIDGVPIVGHDTVTIVADDDDGDSDEEDD